MPLDRERAAEGGKEIQMENRITKTNIKLEGKTFSRQERRRKKAHKRVDVGRESILHD
jgi:hypothetical protein